MVEVKICGRAWGNVADVRRADISWRFIYLRGTTADSSILHVFKAFHLLTSKLTFIADESQDVVSRIIDSTKT